MKSTPLLFLSRLLTKSGDNAWFFAAPMVIVHIYPESLRPVSVFFLLLRVLVMVMMPALGRLLDRSSRLSAIRFAILPQLLFMSIITVLFSVLAARPQGAAAFSKLSEIALFGIIIILTALSQAASHLGSVVLTGDFIPTLFRDKNLTQANTLLRRIDLITEILSPILAGYVLSSFPWEPFFLSGFACISGANLLSFVLEYWVLRSFLKKGALSPNRLSAHNETLHSPPRESSLQRFRREWRLFLSQPALFPMLGLALMHIQVLSPPNVIGSAFLKAGWNLSEDVIGLYRGTGAIMSIVATAFIGGIIKRRGLPQSIALFSALQGMFLFMTAISFHFGRPAAAIYLLGIVLSRFGHSGYILAELQIRQETIPVAQLGLINGLAVSINSIGSLIILFLGVLYADADSYGILVWTSTIAITLCAMLNWVWSKKAPLLISENNRLPLNEECAMKANTRSSL